MIGISNQQQCNYERGRRSISAARLFETALALNVPISFFYERIEEKEPRPAPAHRKCLLEMIRSFAAIPNDRHAEAIYQATLLLSRSVAEAAGR